jgi:hypothetical protein
MPVRSIVQGRQLEPAESALEIHLMLLLGRAQVQSRILRLEAINKQVHKEQPHWALAALKTLGQGQEQERA